MNISMKPLPGLPGPHDVSWVDEALAQIPEADGAFVARPMLNGDGLIAAFGADLPLGEDLTVVRRADGPSTGPARYVQVTRFDRKDTDWTAAFDRAGEERVLPAVMNVPGWVATFVGRSVDGTTVTLTLGESVEALQDCTSAIMRTELLPWEKPDQLTGPDSAAILQLVHVEMPS